MGTRNVSQTFREFRAIQTFANNQKGVRQEFRITFDEWQCLIIFIQHMDLNATCYERYGKAETNKCGPQSECVSRTCLFKLRKHGQQLCSEKDCITKVQIYTMKQYRYGWTKSQFVLQSAYATQLYRTFKVR